MYFLCKKRLLLTTKNNGVKFEINVKSFQYLLFFSPLGSFLSLSSLLVARSLTSAPSFRLRADGCKPGSVVIRLSPTV